MKAIITKYALSTGPRLVNGELSKQSTEDRPMLCAHNGTGFIQTDYYHGNDFQLTKAEAVARVVEMADRLRKSLEKRLANVDKVKAKAIKAIELMDMGPDKPTLLDPGMIAD